MGADQEQNSSHADGITPAEEAETKKQNEIQRLQRIDKPLEQDAYDEGIMSLFGGLGGGLIKGGVMGLGKALITGPAKELAKGVGKSALGRLFGGKSDDGGGSAGAGGGGGTGGAGGGGAGGGGAGGAPGY